MATLNKDFKIKHGLAVTGGGSFGNAVVVGEPTHGTHAATRSYVDTAINTLEDKLDPIQVTVATTASVVISTALAIGQVIDGITLTDQMRVLVKNQTASSENGIYIVSTTGPARDPLFNSSTNVYPGSTIYVASGNVNSGSTWTLTSSTIDVGVSPLTFNFLGPLKAGTGVTIDSTNTISFTGDLGGFATVTTDGGIKSITSDITGSSLTQLGVLNALDVFGMSLFQNSVSMLGTLTVGGETSINNNLAVSGSFNVVGPAQLQNTVEVTGTLTATSDLEVDGNATVLGNFETANLTVDDVMIAGPNSAVTFQNGFTVQDPAIFSGPASFNSTISVGTPTQPTHAANKDYVDNLLNQESVEITTIDDLSNYFNGFESRFKPTYQGLPVTLQNPFNLLLTIDGIIQSVGYPDYVWQSVMPRVGFRIDNDGYIAFPEPIPQGSSFDARVLVGSDVTQQTKVYPFKAMDIVLGGY